MPVEMIMRLRARRGTHLGYKYAECRLLFMCKCLLTGSSYREKTLLQFLQLADS